MGQGENLLERGPQRLWRGEMVAEPGLARFHALRGFLRRADTMPRDKLVEADCQLRLRFQPLRRTEKHTFPVDAEIGVGKAGPPVSELREKRAGIDFGGFQRA